jgi:hypothetical protein
MYYIAKSRDKNSVFLELRIRKGSVIGLLDSDWGVNTALLFRRKKVSENILKNDLMIFTCFDFFAEEHYLSAVGIMNLIWIQNRKSWIRLRVSAALAAGQNKQLNT